MKEGKILENVTSGVTHITDRVSNDVFLQLCAFWGGIETCFCRLSIHSLVSDYFNLNTCVFKQ